MENKGLLFIPDISGFTRFVNETEIDHSRMIIQELLEILVSSNDIGLEISEIEGDAILFYKFGDPPSLEDIYRQVEKMFCEFHKSLLSYEQHRYCQCKACADTIDLTLKVITHYGEFTGYNVRQFNKLIGKDIIVAHQLLKNDIELHEYWLVTPTLAGDHNPPPDLTQWMQWKSSVKQTESGKIPFLYTQLSQLKNEIAEDPLPQPDLSKKVKAVSLSNEYETDIITLFHATGDFNFRSKWMEGIKKVEDIAHFLPRVGMRCRCFMENGEEVIYASSYSYRQEKIEFSETNEANNNITWFTLEAKENNNTKLTIDLYFDKNITDTQKKNAVHSLERSLLNLTTAVKEIKL